MSRFFSLAERVFVCFLHGLAHATGFVSRHGTNPIGCTLRSRLAKFYFIRNVHIINPGRDI